MANNGQCAFCKAACACQLDQYLRNVHWYECLRCGSYLADEYAERQLKDDPQKAFMVACLVQEKQLSKEGKPYAVLDDRVPPPEEHFSKHGIPYWHLGHLLAEFPKPAEIMDRALKNLSRLDGIATDAVSMEWKDLSFLLFCRPSGVPGIFKTMVKKNYLHEISSNLACAVFTITPDGWRRLEELSKTSRESKQTFVAMWFANEMGDVYDKGIKPAIEESGFDARQMSFIQHNDDICDVIVAEIRKSRFIVADFSAGMCGKCDECEKKKDCKDKVRPRGGVYFEAGFAMGLGIPVICTVRKEQLEQIHFDIRQYNFIVYETPEDLKDQLHNRIAATIH
jgi:hypothetical protein